ncbi:YezD family protein [Lysinibacillus odysseyi]|nr:YezD family protein [Lysinibacillus odysseyi]
MSTRKDNLETALENVKKIVSSMKYGSVTLIIQDNYIVQIEKNEKIRLK